MKIYRNSITVIVTPAAAAVRATTVAFSLIRITFVDSPVQPEGLLGGWVHGPVEEAVDVRGDFVVLELNEAVAHILTGAPILD